MLRLSGLEPEREPLSHAWRHLKLAIEEGLRGEATKVVELQAENDALKAAMRLFKMQAQKNMKKLGNLSPHSKLATQKAAAFQAIVHSILQKMDLKT